MLAVTCLLLTCQPGKKQQFPLHPPPRGHSLAFSFFRTINLKNLVLQQVLERKNEVLCVLTQKIVTMQKCVISEHVQIEEKCGGMVGIQTKTVQVRAWPGRRRVRALWEWGLYSSGLLEGVNRNPTQIGLNKKELLGFCN